MGHRTPIGLIDQNGINEMMYFISIPMWKFAYIYCTSFDYKQATILLIM